VAKTFYLDDGASDVVDDGSGIVLGTTAMSASPGGSAALSFVIPNVSSRKRFLVENEADVTRVSTGTLTVHANLTVSGSTTATMTCQAFRVSDTGTILATGAETGTQVATTGVKTFTPAITGLGTWGGTDRLAIAITIANDNAHGGDDTFTLTVGVADTTNDVVASDFTGPPAISGGSFGDSGRDWAAPHQDITVTFDQAVEKSGGAAYNVGDTIPGLTISINGGAGQAVTYRSGDSSTSWVVRVASLIQQDDALTVSYARASGEIVKDGGGSEIVDATNVGLTNGLTKRIRATLKRGDTGAIITTACDLLVLDAEPRDSDDAAWGTVLQRHPNVTPDGAGVVDVQATDATLAVGDPVYLVAFNPREDAAGTASTYARTSIGVVTVA
jgi:hypothetical protein